MSDPTRPCGCCRGTGRVRLTERQLLLLAVMRRGEPGMGSDYLHAEVCCGGGRTATCNALRELETLGLVERNGHGKATAWRLAKRRKKDGSHG